MTTTTSDTLNYFEKLKNAGFTEGQGSGRVRSYDEATRKATKQSSMLWLILFIALLFVCSWTKLLHKADPIQYYICNRRAGVTATSFSMLASCIGGSATLGVIGLASRHTGFLVAGGWRCRSSGAGFLSGPKGQGLTRQNHARNAGKTTWPDISLRLRDHYSCGLRAHCGRAIKRPGPDYFLHWKP